MCVCTHTFLNICIHTCMCMRACMPACIHACTHKYAHILRWVCPFEPHGQRAHALISYQCVASLCKQYGMYDIIGEHDVQPLTPPSFSTHRTIGFISMSAGLRSPPNSPSSHSPRCNISCIHNSVVSMWRALPTPLLKLKPIVARASTHTRNDPEVLSGVSPEKLQPLSLAIRVSAHGCIQHPFGRRNRYGLFWPQANA